MRHILPLCGVILIILVSAGCLAGNQPKPTGFSNEAMDLNSKGLDLYIAGQYEEALGFFNQSVLIAPSFSKAWNNKGLTLMKLGRYSEAVHSFEKVIELDPNYPGVNDNLAEAKAGLKG